MRNISQHSEVTRGLALAPSDAVHAYVLEPGVAQTVSVPEGAGLAVFSSSVYFFALFRDPQEDGQMAAVPAESITDGSSPVFFPQSTSLAGLRAFSVVSSEAGTLTVSFYAV